MNPLIIIKKIARKLATLFSSNRALIAKQNETIAAYANQIRMLNGVVEELTVRLANLSDHQAPVNAQISYSKLKPYLTWAMQEQESPTVIHVGNIAHNAYWNALALQKIGYRNMVLVPDYYHYAACPEWLELSKEGISLTDIGDDFYPNFFQFESSLNMRPRWFLQGPVALVLAAVYFQVEGNRAAGRAARAGLLFYRFKITAERSTDGFNSSWNDNEFRTALKRLSVSQVYKEELQCGFDFHQLRQQLLEDIKNETSIELTPAACPLSAEYLDQVCRLMPKEHQLHAIRSSQQSIAIGLEALPSSTSIEVPKHLQNDAAMYLSHENQWSEALASFKYKIYYAWSSIYAAFGDNELYAAYEHGTIRSIPYIDSPINRLTKYAYQNATVTFITNADYLCAEQKLELSSDQKVYIPHGFDLEACDVFLSEQSSNTSANTVEFIAPARHTWLTGDKANHKGNDIIVKALAKVKQVRPEASFVVKFVSYGEDIEQTKSLISELALESHVVWIDTQTKEQLWKLYINSHAVIDQFIIPAIGAIGVESLALGCRLINADNGSLAGFFEEQPPMLSANNSDELAQRIIEVLDDPEDSAGIGKRAMTWFRRRHSDEQLQKQLIEGIKRIDAAYASTYRSS